MTITLLILNKNSPNFQFRFLINWTIIQCKNNSNFEIFRHTISKTNYSFHVFFSANLFKSHSIEQFWVFFFVIWLETCYAQVHSTLLTAIYPFLANFVLGTLFTGALFVHLCWPVNKSSRLMISNGFPLPFPPVISQKLMGQLHSVLQLNPFPASSRFGGDRVVDWFFHQNKWIADRNINHEPKQVFSPLGSFPADAVGIPQLVCPVHTIHTLCILLQNFRTPDIDNRAILLLPRHLCRVTWIGICW